MVFLTANAVLEKKKYPQRNSITKEWNAAVENLIATEFPDVHVFDVYKMTTSHAMHEDNVHMKPPYYHTVARWILKPLARGLHHI